MSTTVLNGLHSSKNRLPYLDICQATFHHLFNGNVISLFSFVHRLSSRFYFLKTKLVNTMLSTDRDTKYKSDSRSLKKLLDVRDISSHLLHIFIPAFSDSDTKRTIQLLCDLQKPHVCSHPLKTTINPYYSCV